MTLTLKQKLEIVMGLVVLRQQGKLQGVWWSEDTTPSVRWVGLNAPEHITWREAAQMVGFELPEVPHIPFRKTLRKGPKSVIITQKRKEAR